MEKSRSRDDVIMAYYSSPFAILHVDLWLLVYFTDSNGNVTRVNFMCNMTQFVIVKSQWNIFYSR